MNIPFNIVNIVCTAILSRSVDIISLSQIFSHEILHDKEIYGGRVAYFKSETMQGKVTIFPSGKIISVGTRSIEEATRELNLVANTLKTGLTDIKIRNIVATADLGHKINLEPVSLTRELVIIYEPEQFPGAIIKIPSREDNMATILLFASGKLVCVGLKNIKDIKEAIERLFKVVTTI